MAIFLSAGHNPYGKKTDVGATSNNLFEADLTLEFRNLVLNELRKNKNLKIIIDNDSETLSQYLLRIITGNSSLVLEFHCDASTKITASGTTAIVANNATELSKQFARELVNKTSEVLQIPNRELYTETQTARGKIAILHKRGTTALLELFFITNKKDVQQYETNKFMLAKELSVIITKYENLV